MIRAIFLIICFFLVCGQLSSQKVHSNTYFPDIDEPLQFNKELKKFNFSTIRYYYCKDTILQVNNCGCRKIETYDTTGRLIELSAGPDLSKKLVDYIVKYSRVSDTLFKVVTRFTEKYVTENSLFQYDTVVKGKFQVRPIYLLEKNKDVVLSSNLRYQAGHDIPERIDRYDKMGKLQEIYFPLGNRVATEYYDTLNMEERRHIRYRAVYPENEFTSEQILDNNGRLLEEIATNQSFKRSVRAEYTTYVYDEKKRIVAELTRDEKNQFIREKRYFYNDSLLMKISNDYDIMDSIANEVSLFDEVGHLIERQENSSGYPRITWKWKYYYDNGLQSRTDIIKNDVYQSSTFFVYQ